MNTLFDSKGVWGPATTLIFFPCDVEDVSSILATNYEQMSLIHKVPDHRDDFCIDMKTYVLTCNDIIATPFFQSMRGEPTSIHDRVKTILIPAMLKQTPGINSELVTEPILNWLTFFVESYLSESQLKDKCDLQEILSNDDVNTERSKLGMAVYQQVMNKNFSETDLNALLGLLRTDHPEIVIDFAQSYQQLFSMAGEHSSLLRDNICSSFDTTFRSKFFP